MMASAKYTRYLLLQHTIAFNGAYFNLDRNYRSQLYCSESELGLACMDAPDHLPKGSHNSQHYKKSKMVFIHCTTTRDGCW
jgi:hypothetical protein